MKIGIISINIYTKWLNSACPLHSFAIQTFLKRHGYESEIIDYKPSYYDNFNMRNPALYFEKKYATHIKTKKPQDAKKAKEWQKKYNELKTLSEGYRALYDKRELRYDKFLKFIDKYLVVSQEEYDSDTIEVKEAPYDCYMCVTDVIWKCDPKYSLERAFFLANHAMDDKWKIAYSVSRGSSYNRSEEEKRRFFEYIEDFDAISVRENSLKEYIEENSDITCQHVLDPVMLIEREVYEEMVTKPEEENYLLLYHVVQAATDTIEAAIAYAREHNMTIVEISDRPYPEGRVKEMAPDVKCIWKYEIGPDEWLGYIRHADRVFTNSFHACCFSIIFEKELHVGKRNGDKVDNVLEAFNLISRRLDPDKELETTPIDYAPIREKLKVKREESGQFIVDALARTKGVEKQSADYAKTRKRVAYEIWYNMAIPTAGETRSEQLRNSPEYRPEGVICKNDGTTRLWKSQMHMAGYQFVGWKLRFRIDNRWFWIMQDGSFVEVGERGGELESQVKIFKAHAAVPYLNVGNISKIVADAVWQKNGQPKISLEELQRCKILYNSKKKENEICHVYDLTKGSISPVKSGALEYMPDEKFINDGHSRLLANHYFCKDAKIEWKGWNLRIKVADVWYWYLEDGTLVERSNYSKEDQPAIKVWKQDDILPEFSQKPITCIVAEAVWGKKN